MVNLFQLGVARLFLVLALFVSSIGLAAAQNYYNDDFARQANNYVTVYEDCDFRGERRDIPVGEYASLERLRIDNDSISSIRVPAGFEIKVYEDSRFRGYSSSYSNDIRCLDKAWNDEISSLRVTHSNRNNNNRGGRYSEQGVTGSNVSRVDFSGVVLEKNRKQGWHINNQNGTTTNFRELSRDQNAVYLESVRNRERVRIDLFTNKVTVISSNGQTTDYPIARLYRNQNQRNPLTQSRPILKPQPIPQQASNTVRGQCFNYKAYTNGGRGGVKFQGRSGSDQFDQRPFKGRWCQNDNKFAMELTKLKPSTSVTIEIQGRKYTFAANETPDQLLNDWYRKKIVLRVIK